MAIARDVLVDGFERVRQTACQAVEGLAEHDLTHRVDPQTNTIAWLVWHLTRVQDDHVADAAGADQVWSKDGWKDRFELPLPDDATGYGFSTDDVGKVRADAELLTGYLDDVHARTVEFVNGLNDADLDRIVDDSFDPPVTLAARLVSVISDDLQHAGQAALIRGIVERR